MRTKCERILPNATVVTNNQITLLSPPQLTSYKAVYVMEEAPCHRYCSNKYSFLMRGPHGPPVLHIICIILHSIYGLKEHKSITFHSNLYKSFLASAITSTHLAAREPQKICVYYNIFIAHKQAVPSSSYAFIETSTLHCSETS